MRRLTRCSRHTALLRQHTDAIVIDQRHPRGASATEPEMLSLSRTQTGFACHDHVLVPRQLVQAKNLSFPQIQQGLGASWVCALGQQDNLSADRPPEQLFLVAGLLNVDADYSGSGSQHNRKYLDAFPVKCVRKSGLKFCKLKTPTVSRPLPWRSQG